jgi:hypothetical protein
MSRTTALFDKRARDSFRNLVTLGPRALAGGGQRGLFFNKLAGTFISLANTVQTRLDEPGAVVGGFGRSSIQTQVERALNQVLGSASGSTGTGYGRGVDDVFPMGSDGMVATAPVQGLVSTYSTNGNSTGPTVAGFMGDPSIGSIRPEQATLYRQARLVVNDALPVLKALQPRSTDTDPIEVERLRSQVEVEFWGLLEEFGRLDGPRIQRVELYLDALDRDIITFADLIRRDPSPGFTSLEEERQEASLGLVTSHAGSLRSFWNNYLNLVGSDTSTFGPDLTFAERLSRATLLLPAVGETNANLLSAMDAIGFTEQERRLAVIDLATPAAAPPPPPATPSFTTVGAFTAWLDDFSRRGGGQIEKSGQFGLDFMIEQADVLSTAVGNLLIPRQPFDPPLPLAFADDRVRQELEDLLAELDQMADLAI